MNLKANDFKYYFNNFPEIIESKIELCELKNFFEDLKEPMKPKT